VNRDFFSPGLWEILSVRLGLELGVLNYLFLYFGASALGFEALVDFFRVRWGVFAVFMLNCFSSALHSSMSSNMGPLTELSLCKISDLLLLTKVLDLTGLIAYSCRPNILKIPLSLPTI
jgi:hypothetical protein